VSRALDAIEQDTYRRHRTAQGFESIFTAICWAGAEVAIKSFDATTLIVTMIVMAPAMAQVFALFVSRRLRRFGRRRLLRGAALLGRAPLLLVFFIAGPWSFLALLVVQALAQSLIIASWNSLLRSNYRDDKRAHLFAKVTRIGALLSGVATLGAGIWLDYDQTAYRWIYPIAAITGLFACFVFAGIDVRRSENADDDPDAESPRIGELVRLFVADRDFLQFEIGFMLYGTGFMALSTAKPLQMAGVLDLPYATLLGAKTAFSLAMVISSVAIGKMLDRLGPARLAGWSYLGLALYCIALVYIEQPWHLIVAETFFGFLMTGVLIAWNLGPVLFAPTTRVAASYMLIHIALVGVRSAIGHPLGGIVSDLASPRAVFVISAALLLLAGAVMVHLARRREREHRVRPIGAQGEGAEVPGEAQPRSTPEAPE
jgi:MFS family permease